ncbi:MAG: sensor histidine kinase [Candidatus Obscuribacterales bacterium]
MNLFSNIRVGEKGLLLILLPLVFELIFVAALCQRLNETANDFETLKQSQRTLYQLHDMMYGLIRAGALLGRLDSMPQEDRLQAIAEVKANFEKPGHLGQIDLAGDSEFRELFSDAETSRELFLRVIEQFEERASRGQATGYTNRDRDQVIMSLLTLNSLMDRIKASTERLESREPEELKRMFDELVVFLITGFLASSAISFLVAYVLCVDIVSRLGHIAKNALLIAAGKSLPPTISGTDEIADLDRRLHQTGERLRDYQRKELAVLNNTAAIVCRLDRQLRFLSAGVPVERNWGYAPDDLRGRSLITIALDATGLNEDFERLDESPDREIFVRIRTLAGTIRDTSWTVIWSEESSSYVCVVHDITEIRKMEKLKQAFFSMVSHDLRTPLSSININIANMTSGATGEIPPLARKLVQIIEASLASLTSLVNDLLDLDKIEAGKLVLARECLSLKDVCESSVAALESMSTDAGVELSGPQGDGAVMADEKRLFQVVNNLLSNAIKFSPAGSTIAIKIERKGEKLEVRITDNGPGIPKEQQDLLFERYSQGSAITGLSVKGTGLGLAIVKSIILAHGGELGVESEPGRGSTFWFRLEEFVE